MNRLSIITVNYFSADLIKELSENLPNKRIIQYDWVVVDNSDDESQMTELKNIKYIDKIINPKENLGFGKANNLAVSKVSSEYVMFLNPDTKAKNLNLKKLIGVLDADSKIKLVGPKIINIDGTVQLSASKKYPYWWSHKLDYSPLLRILIEKLKLNQYPTLLSIKEHKKSQPVASVLGACILMRKKDFNQLGGFDEDFFMYREESDLAKRIADTGGEIFYFAETSLVHISGGASKNNFYAELNREYTKSEYVFLSKWHSFIYVSFCWVVGWLSTFLSSLMLLLLSLFRPNKRKDYIRMSVLCIKSFIQQSMHPFAIGYYRKHR